MTRIVLYLIAAWIVMSLTPALAAGLCRARLWAARRLNRLRHRRLIRRRLDDIARGLL